MAQHHLTLRGNVTIKTGEGSPPVVNLTQVAARAVRFYQHANTAAAEAVRLGREEHGGKLARLRHDDAVALRRLARATLTT